MMSCFSDTRQHYNSFTFQRKTCYRPAGSLGLSLISCVARSLFCKNIHLAQKRLQFQNIDFHLDLFKNYLSVAVLLMGLQMTRHLINCCRYMCPHIF